MPPIFRPATRRLLLPLQRFPRSQIRSLILGGHQSQNLLQAFNLPVPQERATKILPEFGQTISNVKTAKCPGGQVVSSNTVEYEESWHLALTIDRENYCPVILLSHASEKSTQPPFAFHLNLRNGITSDLISGVSKILGASQRGIKSVEQILNGIYKIFIEKDATLVQINPLVHCKQDGTLLCLNAKITIDNAAEKRQPELFALRDVNTEVAEEVDAERYGLVYVRMDGNVGNVVNGAGLAMATNDAIAFYNGSSANFLDGGGQATKETMIQAFRIVMSDERVKSIFVNVYGGITRCDMIADSVISAASELGPMKVPVVVRLQGTNSAEGLRLLEEANLGLHVEADFGEAAKKAVELAADRSL